MFARRILLSILAVSILSCSGGIDHSTNLVDVEHHLFGYQTSFVEAYLLNSGYSHFRIDKIERNSTGTCLYLHQYHSKDRPAKILSVSKDGKIENLDPPSQFSYLNDQKEFVAWLDEQGVIHFKNGSTRRSPLIGNIFSSFEVDASGKFCFIKIEPALIEITATNNPEKPLFHSALEAERIFYKNDKIYIFARNYKDIKGLGNYKQHEIVYQVYKKDNSGWQLNEEVHIPRPSPRSSPFFVVDMDPWSDDLLIEDTRDMPFAFLTSWYFFNMRTKEMSRIGRAKDFGFFLKEDVLKR